jgi:catechol 2,3-dioxygenase-like lactoylglutathione lyase family enzyme
VGYQVIGLDHVQLAMPKGRETKAESFYSGLLGFTRLPKPEPMASRGGCWFAAGQVALHLGVDADFRPAKKAHPALVVRDLSQLMAVMTAAEVDVRPNPDLPPGAGCYVDDPFGNRIELIDADGAGRSTKA